MLYPDIIFAPQSQTQVKTLLRFLDNKEYGVYRKRTVASHKFCAAVDQLRQHHKNLYANYQGLGFATPDLWHSSGLYARCQQVAEQFRVPVYDVISSANSGQG